VKSIGDYAFSGCSSLAGLTIPSGVASLGNSVFSGCAGLRTLTIPSSVRTIGDYVFSGCSSLASARISANIKSLGNNVFAGCTALTNLTLSGSVTSIGDYAFSGCSSLATLTLSSGLTSLGNNAFSDCSSLRSITIPSRVSAIGDYAFADCTSLASVTLPAKITSTGNYTFLGCTSLRSITIPGKTTQIGDYAFSGCTGLDGVTIPSSVTSIGAGSFLNCTSLVTVTIPGSVVSIGYEAFSGCTGLTGVLFEGSAPTSVDSDVFLGANGAEVYYGAGTSGWNTTFSERPTVLVSAPVIIQGPTNQDTLAGGAVTFRVSAFGPGTLKYQWQFNGGSLPGAKSSTLTLSSVESKNAGDYTVVVASSYGSVTSSPAVLTVETVAGTYKGLITPGDPFDNTTAGAFALAVTSGGAFSAQLRFPGEVISASGEMALYDGQSHVATARFTKDIGGRGVEVLVQLALDSSRAVTGSLTAVEEGKPLAQIDGAAVANTTNFGVVNLALLSGATNPPTGDGYGTVAVSTSGARINLVLGNEKISVRALASDRLSRGAIPVFAPLYSKKGFISGWLTPTNEHLFSDGPLAWHQEPGVGASAPAEGFDQWVSVEGGSDAPGTPLAPADQKARIR
jgi:hypothetical protein